MTSSHNEAQAPEKRTAALSSVIAAIFLTSMKLVVGVLTGSLGILSEAAHSGLDLVAALVTFFAVRISDKPADEEHQFGHGKVENLSALVETLLLFITCAWIIYEAVNRLFFKSVEIEASIWAFAVMGISIAVDFSRSRMLMRAAKAHNSQALEADALHFSTDIWSSSVVILGLTLVRIGEMTGVAWLSKADAVAAMGVAGIVIVVSARLGQRAIAALIDSAPNGIKPLILDAVRQVPGVREVSGIRLRQSGPSTFVELVIAVAKDISVEESHRIATAVEETVLQHIPQADVIVHVETATAHDEEWPAKVRAIAAEQGLRVHGLHAHQIGGKTSLHMHVEVGDKLTLEEAHARVSAFEMALRPLFPSGLEVVSHIEPVGENIPPEQPSLVMDDERIKLTVLRTLGDICDGLAPHDIHVLSNSAGHYDVSLHCELRGEIPIVEAHRLSDEAESAIRRALPNVRSVLIHVEPSNHSGSGGAERVRTS